MVLTITEYIKRRDITRSLERIAIFICLFLRLPSSFFIRIVLVYNLNPCLSPDRVSGDALNSVSDSRDKVDIQTTRGVTRVQKNISTARVVWGDLTHSRTGVTKHRPTCHLSANAVVTTTNSSLPSARLYR